MVTRKQATPKVKEVAPKYTARSRAETERRRPPSPRVKKTAPGEALWQYFLTLSDEEQGAFIRSMLSTPEWREDLADSILIMESRDEPHRPIEEFYAELDAERKRK